MRHVRGFWNEVVNNWIFDVDVRLVEMDDIHWELDSYLGHVEYTDGYVLDIFNQCGQLVGVEWNSEA